MKGKMNRKTTAALRHLVSCIALATALVVAMTSPSLAADAPKKAAAKAPAQKAFATPEELFQALVDAAKANDAKALSPLLGSKSDALVHSGDAVADKQRGEKFAADYATKHSVTKDGDAKATLVVGNDDWPMPIPAVKGANGWTLDTAAGSREILARRIGENELNAIQVIRAIADAQIDYSSEDRDLNGIRDYARKFASSPGKKDGLYWPTKEGEPPSPLGPLVVQAASQGYKGKAGTPVPYHGYYYRILTAQGKDAKGGARSYIVQGNMIGGFAVVAYPARYENSGIMTFIVNYDGTVYQKDLGPNTAKIAGAMKAYNPDASWTAVK
jgi:hypothetical protein